MTSKIIFKSLSLSLSDIHIPPSFFVPVFLQACLHESVALGNVQKSALIVYVNLISILIIYSLRFISCFKKHKLRTQSGVQVVQRRSPNQGTDQIRACLASACLLSVPWRPDLESALGLLGHLPGPIHPGQLSRFDGLPGFPDPGTHSHSCPPNASRETVVRAEAPTAGSMNALVTVTYI